MPESILSDTLELTIDRTWDGEPVAPDDQASLRLSPRSAGLSVSVDAPFHGDPAPPGAPGPCARLWNHEVVELFIAGGDGNPADGEPRYTELEMSPHGHYLLLRLRGIRRIVEERLVIAYRARISGRRWHGEALVPWHLLPAPPHHGNAFAIHGAGSGRRYLAWTPVPGREPDFHRLEMFQPLDLGRLPGSTELGG